jgi:nucleotide-binding universal stress UspA family protein
MAGLHPKTTLVPIDFSDLSYAALDQALEIADDAETHVVYVLPPLHAMDPGNLYAGITEQKRIDSTIDFIGKRLTDEKYASVKPHAAIGDPGHEIADLASRLEADLVVMPSHGYGFVKRILMGAVAERVVRLAHCPVLVLRS